MRVTEKGQVTIPKHIRDRLNIGPGSEVAFVADDNVVQLIKITGGKDEIVDFDAWLKSVEGTLDLGGMSTDEYMDWLRGPRDDLDRR
jgi:AbrB family looped-hinge helix DNA binding protein